MTRPFPRLTLVLGGARAGKSRFAEGLMNARPGRHAVIATGTAGDAEMAARIARHRAERNPAWETIEEPLALAAAIRAAARPDRIVLVDCLTLWRTQLALPVSGAPASAAQLAAAGERLTEALGRLPGPVVLVSNEIGLGVVPATAETRAFVDALGTLHQRVATVCERVTLMVAGQALAVKGGAA